MSRSSSPPRLKLNQRVTAGGRYGWVVSIAERNIEGTLRKETIVLVRYVAPRRSLQSESEWLLEKDVRPVPPSLGERVEPGLVKAVRWLCRPPRR